MNKLEKSDPFDVEALRKQVSDIAKAQQWYEDKNPGLGVEFLDDVERVLARIASRPYQYPAVHRDVRRAVVRRFPYGVFYTIRDSRVLVVACFHARRDPNLLFDRIK